MAKIYLTAEQSEFWDDASERGERFRRDMRREAQSRANEGRRTVGIESSDGITLDAVSPES